MKLIFGKNSRNRRDAHACAVSRGERDFAIAYFDLYCAASKLEQPPKEKALAGGVRQGPSVARL
ncbi:MAG: hypothetical protein KA144_00825 [Xanthomonadaceae bacterium]|nr:hypothetical protein [Xanthomonadaceae bacterium]